MKLTKLLSAALLTASLLWSTQTVAAAAAAAPCTVTANLPARISIDRPDKVVPVYLAGCAGRLSFASAQLYGASGTIDYLLWDGSRTDYLDLYDWNTKPGVYQTTAGDGYDTEDEPVAWHYTATTIKFAGLAGIAASRSGTTTVVTVAAKRYDAASSGYVGYPYLVMGIQTASTASGPWRVATYVRVGAGSRATVGVAAAPGQYYRSYFGDGPSFFGATSAVVRA